MSKKIPMILGLVWLLAATALYGYAVWNGQPDGVYTYDNDGCTLNRWCTLQTMRQKRD